MDSNALVNGVWLWRWLNFFFMFDFIHIPRAFLIWEFFFKYFLFQIYVHQNEKSIMTSYDVWYAKQFVQSHVHSYGNRLENRANYIIFAKQNTKFNCRITNIVGYSAQFLKVFSAWMTVRSSWLFWILITLWK